MIKLLVVENTEKHQDEYIAPLLGKMLKKT